MNNAPYPTEHLDHDDDGVLFDADVHGLACYMEAENIETL